MLHRKISAVFSLKHCFFPKNNHWLKRTGLVSAFIIFDYFLTLVFCRAPWEEANVYARIFMENFGIPFGLTLFVFSVNLPIYVTLCLDSHFVKLPLQVAVVTEIFVDVLFAWFIAGLHFSGGLSWVWYGHEWMRQALGALLYLIAAFLFVKPYKPHYD